MDIDNSNRAIYGKYKNWHNIHAKVINAAIQNVEMVIENANMAT